jgi:NodT family efflux transporter outer membrane factor (OMF) lipoprotein
MRSQHLAQTALGAAVVALVAGLGGCAVGPNYSQPKIDNLPVAWKIEPPWRESSPDDAAAKGPWWQRYADPQLEALETQALANSPTLQIAAARLSQARSQLAGASASVFPSVGLGTRAQRFKISADRPLSGYGTPNFGPVQDEYALSLTVSYEADLFGRVQRSIEGARATAQQSAIDLENTRLVLTTDLATAYFNLRGEDAEIDALNRSIALQRRALDYVTQRHDLGVASGLEVAEQQALLDNTLVQVDVLKRLRDQFEHALATLTGVAAPQFALAADLKDVKEPAIPLGMPSDLLQRRPDVASAERAMAVANAQIGVATAAFYPSIVVGPQYGVDSRNFSSLFDAPSLLWSLGVSATAPIFDGGRIRANVNFSKAGYDATVASYRRTVLTAMQEVEDGITGLAALDRASAQSQRAITSSRKVLDLATSRYEGGATTYLDVINAQQSLLGIERQATQLQSQRRVTSVFLIKALGGDWAGTGDEHQSLAN